MPTATHALWALQIMNQENQVPDLSHLLTSDLSWWAQVYTPAYDLLPTRWRISICESISGFLEEMEPPHSLEQINHFDE